MSRSDVAYTAVEPTCSSPRLLGSATEHALTVSLLTEHEGARSVVQARLGAEGFEVVLRGLTVSSSRAPSEGSSLTADLDNAFRYELEESIERGLLADRPILSHLTTATFRGNLVAAIDRMGRTNLQPWIGMLAPGRPPPLHGTDKLTAGQVALLGGTRPLRILHSVVLDLDVLLDGGHKRSLKSATMILEPTSDALHSLVDHQVVAPVKGLDASARKLGALVDLGVAAQIASTMGALHFHRLHREDASGDDDLIQRYFLGMVQVFGQITLARNDQQVFSDHYIDGSTWKSSWRTRAALLTKRWRGVTGS